jgi:hypothetical protein
MAPAKRLRLLRASLLAAAVVLTATTGPPSALAQVGDPSPSTTPTLGTFTPDALTTAVQLAIEYTRVSERLSSVTRSLQETQSRVGAAQAQFVQADQVYTGVLTELQSAVNRLQGRAVASYERNQSLIGADLEIRHVQSLAAGRRYVEDAAAADTTTVDRLTNQLSDVKANRDRHADAVRDLQAQLVVLNTEHDKLSAQAASDQAALDSLGGVPVLGQARLDAHQIAGWFHSTGVQANLASSTTIDQLAQIYAEEGAATNVRGDLAFAQAIIETGSFGHATDNNYAGIGACDSCHGEPAFPSPRDGVRAQVQLLRSYADPDSTSTNLGNPPDPTLFGTDPATAAATFDHFALKGKVPLWNLMGHGNWATDPNYAGKVLRVYAAMLAFVANPRDGG